MEKPSEIILSKLGELGLEYSQAVHEPIYTVEAGLAIARRLGVRPCKCLLLRTRHKEYYMILLPGNKQLSVKDVSGQIGSSRLSFASKEDLEELLHVEPGAVSPLGLLFDTDGRIKFMIDDEIALSEYILCHPNDNACSLKLGTTDLLEKYLPATGHPVCRMLQIP